MRGEEINSLFARLAFSSISSPLFWRKLRRGRASRHRLAHFAYRQTSEHRHSRGAILRVAWAGKRSAQGL